MVSKNAQMRNRPKLSLPKAAGPFSGVDNQEVDVSQLDESSPEAAFAEAVYNQDADTNTEETGKTTETQMTTEEAPSFELTQQDAPKAETNSSVVSVIEEDITPITQIPNARSTVSPASCVKALEKSLGFGRTSFYLEVGVCLAVFASSTTGADLATRKTVREIYQKAGYDVENEGADYKTVSRRVIICAKLFNKLGADVVNAAMSGMRDYKAIESLCGYLGETRRFNTMNAVLEYVGEPVPQTNTPEVRAARSAALVRSLAGDAATDMSIDDRMAAQKAARVKKEQEESDGITIFTSTLSIVLPRDVTSAEVRAMANKLTEYAERLEEQQGTPEEQRNREMHS